MKLDILAIGAHPDDVELGCGATLAKEVAQGRSVGIVDLTRGELGTRGTAKTRHQEAAAAAEILGVSVRVNMGFSDGFFRNDQTHQLKLIQMIRKYQPELVICNAIEDRHCDHAKASQLVSDVCFLSGLLKIETMEEGVLQSPWRPKQIYHYIQWKPLPPDVIVDVSAHFDLKKKAVMAYKTQFYDPDTTAPKTPISSKNFIDSVTYRAQDLGRLVGVDYAEGFTAERVITVDSLFNLK